MNKIPLIKALTKSILIFSKAVILCNLEQYKCKDRIKSLVVNWYWLPSPIVEL